MLDNGILVDLGRRIDLPSRVLGRLTADESVRLLKYYGLINNSIDTIPNELGFDGVITYLEWNDGNGSYVATAPYRYHGGAILQQRKGYELRDSIVSKFTAQPATVLNAATGGNDGRALELVNDKPATHQEVSSITKVMHWDPESFFTQVPAAASDPRYIKRASVIQNTSGAYRLANPTISGDVSALITYLNSQPAGRKCILSGRSTTKPPAYGNLSFKYVFHGSGNVNFALFDRQLDLPAGYLGISQEEIRTWLQDTENALYDFVDELADGLSGGLDWLMLDHEISYSAWMLIQTGSTDYNGTLTSSNVVTGLTLPINTTFDLYWTGGMRLGLRVSSTTANTITFTEPGIVPGFGTFGDVLPANGTAVYVAKNSGQESFGVFAKRDAYWEDFRVNKLKPELSQATWDTVKNWNIDTDERVFCFDAFFSAYQAASLQLVADAFRSRFAKPATKYASGLRLMEYDSRFRASSTFPVGRAVERGFHPYGAGGAPESDGLSFVNLYGEVDNGTWDWKNGGYIDNDFSKIVTGINASANEIVIQLSPFETGQRIISTVTRNGLTTDQTYYVRKVAATRYSLHPSRADAFANLNPLDVTGTHTGNFYVVNAALREWCAEIKMANRIRNMIAAHINENVFALAYPDFGLLGGIEGFQETAIMAVMAGPSFIHCWTPLGTVLPMVQYTSLTEAIEHADDVLGRRPTTDIFRPCYKTDKFIATHTYANGRRMWRISTPPIDLYSSPVVPVEVNGDVIVGTLTIPNAQILTTDVQLGRGFWVEELEPSEYVTEETLEAYANRGQIENVFGKRNVAEWSGNSSTRVNWALSQATDLVDERLAGGPVAVPFVKPYPKRVQQITARLAGILLYEARGISDTDMGIRSAIGRHRKNVDQWLADILARRETIVGITHATDTPKSIDN